MNSWKDLDGGQQLAELNRKAAKYENQLNDTKQSNGKGGKGQENGEVPKSVVLAHAAYGAFRMAISTLKAASESIPLIGAAVGPVCTIADMVCDKLEKMVLNNGIAGNLSGRVKRQLPTLKQLKTACERRKDEKNKEVVGQILPHIANLGELYIKVHETVAEWGEVNKETFIMRMLSSTDLYKDLIHLETMLTSAMTDLNMVISTTQLLTNIKVEKEDPEALKQRFMETMQRDLQCAMRDILDAEVNGSISDSAVTDFKAQKLFKEFGLDFKTLKSKEAKRWRNDKLRDLLIPWSELKPSESQQIHPLNKSAPTNMILCYWKRHLVAVKKYTLMVIPDAQAKRAVEREGYIMSQLRHPNIIQSYGVVSEDKVYEVDDKTHAKKMASPAHNGIVMEYHKSGSLAKLMRDAREAPDAKLPVKQRVELALQIARGMAYLHGRSRGPIVHGRLKPSNVLIADNGRAVITDFGAASESSATASVSSTSMLPSQTDAFEATTYFAPELSQLLLSRQKSPPSVDVFSFGVLLFELLTLQPASQGFATDATEYSILIQDRKRPRIPDELPMFLKYCIEQCWKHEPEQRPSFVQVVDMLNMVYSSLR